MTVLGIYSWPELWSMGERRGAESFYLTLSAPLRFGHQVVVVSPRLPDQPLEETVDGIRFRRFRTTRSFIPDPFRQPRLLRVSERILKYVAFQLTAYSTALRVAREIRPDLVVAYGAFAVPAARAVARRLGVPNVTRLFGQSLSLCVGRRLKWWGNFPEIFAMKIPAAYVILHDDGALGDEMARRLGVPPERFRYWKNGIDPNLYRPGFDTSSVRRELGWTDGEVLLFAVARMVYEKHLERILLALPQVLAEEPRVRLFLVGDGPKRAELEALARDLGLEEVVRFVGAKPREEIHRYFNTGDIFLSVSDRTNAGNPTVEAMYCARCVIALDTGGTSRLVQHGRTGLLVDPNRLEDLPRVILQAVRDPRLRRRLGEAARASLLGVLPTIEERQRMEVELLERAVREARAGEAA
jgi:glycosyltransferase involved in cell wall biosynthesis